VILKESNNKRTLASPPLFASALISCVRSLPAGVHAFPRSLIGQLGLPACRRSRLIARTDAIGTLPRGSGLSSIIETIADTQVSPV